MHNVQRLQTQCYQLIENDIVLTHFGFFHGEIVVSGFLSKHRPATIAGGQIDRVHVPAAAAVAIAVVYRVICNGFFWRAYGLHK